MEVLKVSPVIRIFVQKPGTLVRARDLSAKTKDHVAVPAESGAVGPDLSLDVTVPFFGAGRQTVPSASGEQELLSDRLYVYNPIIHLQQDVGRASGGLRAEASAIAKDERVYVFGGLAQTNVMEAPKTTAILDLFVVGREGFSSFFLEKAPAYDGGTDVARKRTVLATAGRPVFAFGGLDSADRPLDSVVLIDVDARPQTPVSLLPMRMVGAREGHTATTVSTSDPWGNILVFGGTAADKPVAELFEPMKSEWLPLDLSMAGSGRREHVALNLPASTEPRVLILGGRGPDMAPRADSVIYYPAQRAFGPSPLTLQQPRTGFVAFVINDDLVVAGGYDATGKLIETAEVYDVKNWQLQGTPAAVPRARATATALPNLSVVILGGETSGSSSNAVEIYQPRR
jgi:hypothetical protein